MLVPTFSVGVWRGCAGSGCPVLENQGSVHSTQHFTYCKHQTSTVKSKGNQEVQALLGVRGVEQWAVGLGGLESPDPSLSYRNSSLHPNRLFSSLYGVPVLPNFLISFQKKPEI